MNKPKFIIILVILIMGNNYCSKNTDSPGYQYFDDMEKSPSIKSYDVDCDTHITCKEVPNNSIEYKLK
jgi:hypothetical protein